MRNGRRVATIEGAALVGARPASSPRCRHTRRRRRRRWVNSFAITYEAAGGQATSVKTAKVFPTSGEVRWHFTDVVTITAGAGCYHPAPNIDAGLVRSGLGVGDRHSHV